MSDEEDIEWSAGDDQGYGDHEDNPETPSETYGEMVGRMNRNRGSQEERLSRFERMRRNVYLKEEHDPEQLIGFLLEDEARDSFDELSKPELIERLQEYDEKGARTLKTARMNSVELVRESFANLVGELERIFRVSDDYVNMVAAARKLGNSYSETSSYKDAEKLSRVLADLPEQAWRGLSSYFSDSKGKNTAREIMGSFYRN